MDKVELNGSSRWIAKFQFHLTGAFSFWYRVVIVRGAATVEFKAAPGLSTSPVRLPVAAFTVTKGWNGELPPGKMLSSSPIRVANSPAPARNTVFESDW